MSNPNKTFQKLQRPILAILFSAFAILLMPPAPAAAQQVEVTFTDFYYRAEFGDKVKRGHSFRGVVPIEELGPGSVILNTTVTAKASPGLVTQIVSGLAPWSLALAAIEVDLTASLSGPQSFNSPTRRERCSLVEGDIPGFINRMVLWGFGLGALVDALADNLLDQVTVGAVSCSVWHAALFDSLRDGDWTLEMRGTADGRTFGGVEGTVEGVTVVLSPEILLPPSGDNIGSLQFRYACFQGTVWSGQDNQCVCDPNTPPESNPRQECRPLPVECQPRQIEQEGACIDCPPNTLPIENECLPTGDGPDDDDEPGGPGFCSDNSDHEDCLNCEWVDEWIQTGPETGFFHSVMQCESTFPWTASGLGTNQALWDCLYIDPVCYFEHSFTKTLPEAGELPPTGYLSACTEGLGWRPCADTNPALRPLVPNIDHLLDFPDCYTTSTGVAITPCGDTLPDGQEGPDLVIEEPQIDTTHPMAGELVWMSFTVANRGTEAAPNTTWRVQANMNGTIRTKTGVIGSLAAGASRSFDFSSEDLWFVPQEGSLSFRITADHNGSLSELNENNNERLVGTYVTSGQSLGGADLVANIAGVTIENPVVGETVTALVSVINVGTSAAGESALLLSVVDPEGNWLPEVHDLPALNAGENTTLSIALGSDVPGALFLTARADASFEVSEVNEANNEGYLTLQFAAPDVCLPCTSGQPNNQVGATVCLESWDGIVHEGDRFQCFGVRPDGTTCSPGGDHPNGWYSLGLRCPDPWTLCEGTHPDRCGIPDICPGTMVCD